MMISECIKPCILLGLVCYIQHYNKNCKQKSILFSTHFDKIKAKSLELLEEGIEIEYLESIDTETFEQVSALKENTLVALAAKIAGVRLIDNVIF